MSDGGDASPAFADAVIVAAGSSQRMDGVDKLAWSVAGRPLLARTVAAIAAAPVVGAIVVVTSAERRAAIADADWLPPSVIDVVVGGERRQDSVRAGIEALERRVPDPTGRRVVLVHDGARPLVFVDLVVRVADAAATHGAAIPVTPGHFEAKVFVEPGAGTDALMPGMACTVKLVPYLKKEALLAPAASVFTDELDEDSHHVWLSGKDGKPEKRVVRVGKKTGDKVEILDGLKEGDDILQEKPKPAKKEGKS